MDTEVEDTMNSSRIYHLLYIPIILLLFIGCAEEKFHATTDLETFQKYYKEQQEDNKKKNDHHFLTAEVVNNTPVGDYLLGPGDLITVTVFETEDLNAEVRISARGFITLPLIERMDVLNLSTAEAEEKIENLLREKYLHNPHVSVYIKEHVSKQITLVGAVHNPGTFDYVTKKRLLDVIALGDGLQEKAGTIAYVNRVDPKTRKNISYMVDLDDLTKEGNMAQNLVVLGGDVIFVPESGQCFIDGAVRKPGTYELERNMTITEAIALAGGLANYADDDSIKLIRYNGKGKKRDIVNLSYSDLQAGLGDTLILQDQDIIFAESSSSGTLFSGAGFTLGFMGTGVSYKNPQQ